MATQKKTKPTANSLKGQDELRAELVTLQTELVEARRSHAARELANTNRLSELRRSIARIKTALNTQRGEEKN